MHWERTGTPGVMGAWQLRAVREELGWLHGTATSGPPWLGFSHGNRHYYSTVEYTESQLPRSGGEQAVLRRDYWFARVDTWHALGSSGFDGVQLDLHPEAEGRTKVCVRRGSLGTFTLDVLQSSPTDAASLLTPGAQVGVGDTWFVEPRSVELLRRLLTLPWHEMPGNETRYAEHRHTSGNPPRLPDWPIDLAVIGRCAGHRDHTATFEFRTENRLPLSVASSAGAGPAHRSTRFHAEGRLVVDTIRNRPVLLEWSEEDLESPPIVAAPGAARQRSPGMSEIPEFERARREDDSPVKSIDAVWRWDFRRTYMYRNAGRSR